jgi:hypothetical protein
MKVLTTELSPYRKLTLKRDKHQGAKASSEVVQSRIDIAEAAF